MALALGLIGHDCEAFGQVFTRPSAFQFDPIAGGPEGQGATDGTLACACSGQNMLVGRNDGTLWELGAVNYLKKLRQLSDFQAVFPGIQITGIRAMANSRMLDMVYIALDGTVEAGGKGGPVASMVPWGAYPINPVVTPDELLAVMPGASAVTVCGLAVGSSGVLWAGVQDSKAATSLLRIVPDNPEGERVSQALSSQQLHENLGGLGTLTSGWACQLAADPQDRAFFRVQQDITDGETSQSWFRIMRRDDDGNLAELAQSKGGSCG